MRLLSVPAIPDRLCKLFDHRIRVEGVVKYLSPVVAGAEIRASRETCKRAVGGVLADVSNVTAVSFEVRNRAFCNFSGAGWRRGVTRFSLRHKRRSDIPRSRVLAHSLIPCLNIRSATISAALNIAT